MWQHCVLEDAQARSRVRFTLPVLSPNKNLLSNRPQLKREKELKLDEEIICTLSEDISQTTSPSYCTASHLSSRHQEISQWQALIYDSIRQVDQEITAVEQMRATAQACLQEKQEYSQLMSNCVALSNSMSSAVLRQNIVLTELKKEERLTNDVTELLQKQIHTLLDNLSSLKEVHTQLLADFQDKSEAIKLTAKCIMLDICTPSSQPSAGQYKANCMSHDQWLSHCKDLRLTADKLIKNSSSFRANLRFNLANLRKAQERQYHLTDDALRRRINELSRVQETLIWDRQQIMDEISDVTVDIQKVMGQIRNCESKLCQATNCLDILSQRPRRELCLDQPYISLMLEKHDLTKMAAELSQTLMRFQQDLELTHGRLRIVEEKLARNAQTLKQEQKCQSLHQSFLPALKTNVVITNMSQLHRATPSLTSTYSRAG